MLPFYDICRRRPQMSEQKGKSVKNKELIKEKIIFYIKEHGYAPTVREICEMTNLKSTSSVQSYLCKMFENWKQMRKLELLVQSEFQDINMLRWTRRCKKIIRRRQKIYKLM